LELYVHFILFSFTSICWKEIKNVFQKEEKKKIRDKR